MSDTVAATQHHILEAGKKEFLSKGFNAASLRSIVREANVTTGAFYGYYKSKEELFDALVAEPFATLMEQWGRSQQLFADLPAEEQPGHMGDISGDCMDWMTEYIYDNYDAFKLLLCCAEGTRYENFIHNMVETEVDSTHRFLKVLRSLGHTVRDIDPQLEHILASGLFSAYFEIVIHDMPQEQAAGYVKELRDFFTAGWKKIMGL